MNAMLHQISPQTVLTHFESIAKASSAMVSTDIPASEVDRFMQLALKAKGQKVATLSLVPPMITTAHPDIALIKRKVAETIATSEGHGTAPVRRHKKPSVVTGGSVGSLRTGYAANQATDLGAVC
jgi:hypothetical protein